MLTLFAVFGFSIRSGRLEGVLGGKSDRSLSKPVMNPSQDFPKGYTEAEPKYSSMLDVLLAWNPDDPTLPSSKSAADTLEVLDWTNSEDRERATQLRDLEIPFKLIKLENVVSRYC